MLLRESELRLSSEIQYQMAEAESGNGYNAGNRSWLDVVNKIQHKVVTEFKFKDMEMGLNLLRSTWTLFPTDKELHNIAHWIKYNKAQSPDNILGKEIPSSLLIAHLLDEKEEGQPTKLELIPLFSKDLKFQILVASSLT